MPKGGKRTGSGVKPRAGVKSTNRSFKATDEELESIKAKAKESGTTTSEYIRTKALNQ